MSIIYDALKKLEKGSDKPYSNTKELLRRGGLSWKKVSLIALILGFFAAAFFLSYNFFNLQGFRRTQLSREVSQKEKQDLSPALPVESQVDSKGGLIAQPEPEAKEAEAYRLEGIIFTESSPFAIISGVRVHEKDKLGDLVVTRISRNSVELSNPKTDKKTDDHPPRTCPLPLVQKIPDQRKDPNHQTELDSYPHPTEGTPII